MKKVFLFILPLLLLVSCQLTYVEVYNIERYPMEREEIYISEPSHWHHCDKNNNWYCVETHVDTFTYIVNDTMDVPVYKGTYKMKEYKKLILQKENGNTKCH
jgi:hypothetical protein